MQTEKQDKADVSPVQAVWGAALAFMGVCFFFRVPEVMERVAEIPAMARASWFIRFCLYLLSVILMGGGAKKLSAQYKAGRARVKQAEGVRGAEGLCETRQDNEQKK